jgi:SAM-dependent methyltransferase
MARVQDHYDEHLGPIYEWMAGPFEEACIPSTRLFDELHVEPADSGVAVDLGCGHGLQAIPLAKRGFRVVAIDLCGELLADLVSRTGILPIDTANANIMEFGHYSPPQVDLVVCMGDTLTHLSSLEDVEELIGRIGSALAPGGLFIATFRDYVTHPLEGEARFIPVRSDSRRVLTCFLEYLEGVVRVHDLVHERTDSGWDLTVSSYEKLRLDPQWLVEVMRKSGLEPIHERTTRGVVSLAARLQEAV